MEIADDLRYPIGREPRVEARADARQREAWIDAIARLPQRVRAAVAGFTREQWDTPYRPGGWTVRQLIHHLPDSHLNAYTRFKLALTETEPTIKPYDEAAWAELPDSGATDPAVSLQLLEALHARWVVLLRAMSDAEFLRTLRHPEHGRTFTLEQLLAQYAWHGEHHLRHVTALVERQKWTRMEGVATTAFLEFSRSKLVDEYWPRLRRAVESLSDEQLWWRPNDASNSVGNLLLHLNGNVRQWLVDSFNRAWDNRNRPAEFAAREGESAAVLLSALGATIDEASAVLARLREADLQAPFQIQGYTVTGLHAVYHVVEHFGMHYGQILYITKLLRGADLGFYRELDRTGLP